MESVLNKVTNSQALPHDGHTIILLEPGEGTKTFKEAPSLMEGLELMVSIYEDYREARGSAKDFELEDIHRWLDHFRNAQMLVYEGELNRYRHLDREQFKRSFVETIKRLQADNAD